MSEDNVWLAGRRQEHDALGRIIVTLEHTRPADGTVRAVRGAQWPCVKPTGTASTCGNALTITRLTALTQGHWSKIRPRCRHNNEAYSRPAKIIFDVGVSQ